LSGDIALQSEGFRKDFSAGCGEGQLLWLSSGDEGRGDWRDGKIALWSGKSQAGTTFR
jgi:hypothetical protein